MESVESLFFLLVGVVLLFVGITFILHVLCVVIGIFGYLFLSPRCPNCAKRIGEETLRCPRCGSSVREEQSEEEMNPELLARVKTLVAEQRAISAEELTADTLLADDLGIAGDDGYELLEAFCEEFEIENMCEIHPYEYFGPEAWNPFEIYVVLYDWVFKRKERGDSGITPLYLRDLVKSAEAKKWIPPETVS